MMLNINKLLERKHGYYFSFIVHIVHKTNKFI